KRWKIYKCVGKTKLADHEQFSPQTTATTLMHATGKPKNASTHLAEIFKDTLLEETRYAGILIDENMEVKQAIGHFSDFLQLPENNLSFNLIKLVPSDLGVALGIAIRKSIKDQERTVMRNVKVTEGNTERNINIVVKPYIKQHEYQQPFLFIILHEE